jgi:hypothetical protein
MRGTIRNLPAGREEDFRFDSDIVEKFLYRFLGGYR